MAIHFLIDVVLKILKLWIPYLTCCIQCWTIENNKTVCMKQNKYILLISYHNLVANQGFPKRYYTFFQLKGLRFCKASNSKKFESLTKKYAPWATNTPRNSNFMSFNGSESGSPLQLKGYIWKEIIIQ